MDYSTATSLKKTEIGGLWQKHCSKFTSNESACVQRLAFVLAHYQLWIRTAAEKALNTKTDITCMQEMMDLLKNYSRPLMMDDYYVIKATIEKENADSKENESEDQKTVYVNNNNNISNASLHEIRLQFQKLLGQCKNFSNCNCFVRNRRSRSSDSITEERREAFYIRTEDIQKYENRSQKERISNSSTSARFEVKEVILQSSLDIIHNYIFHAKDEELNVNKSHSSKFVTNVVMEEENDSKNNNNEQNNAKKIGQYSFGCQTTYWTDRDPDFILAKYSDLKTELLSNALHPISILMYEMLEERARDILKTLYGKNLKSKREHQWMEIKKKQLIPKGSLITEKHLIAVLAYTNHDKMQYEFKRLGFRKLSDNEKQSEVRKRNAEIAHWSRALMEVIHCWGVPMSQKRLLFHGINCKLLFNRFSYLFCMPTSLTTNVRIAQNFAKENGIILVLKHAGETDDRSLMFDVSPMSDYPNEEERLILKTQAQFYDIILDGSSLKQWMKVLRIYEKITLGVFLSHVSFSVAQQEMIVNMMDNYLEDLKGKNKKNDDFYENGNVPNYVQLLFNECTYDCKNGFYINSFALKNAISNEKLLQYLDGSQRGKNSKFLSNFNDVCEAHVYEWLVTGDAYAKYFSDSHPWVVHPTKFKLNLMKDADAKPLFLEFHWEMQNKKNNGLLRCFMFCDHMPDEVSQVAMNIGIFIQQTKSEASCGSFLNRNKLFAGHLHSIVDSKKLMVENNLSLTESGFNVKLFVVIKSCAFTKTR